MQYVRRQNVHLRKRQRMSFGSIKHCWICSQDRICSPVRSNPNGILSGAIVWRCKECTKRRNDASKRERDNEKV